MCDVSRHNHLNLPNSINNPADSYITLTYTADGEKLTKISPAGTRNYVAGIEYLGANLEAIEGRCTPNGATAFHYEYTLKDHLGNARVNFRANGTAVNFLEEMHYYPFGMLMEGIGTAAVTVNKYKYNGKELNDDLGLNLSDYGARWYDSALGRWWSVDPLGEEYANYSSYNYGLNNPSIVIDPTGENAEIIIDMDKKTVNIRMNLVFYGDNLGKENFNATETSQSIQDQWNSGTPSIKVNGVDYSVNFQISGELKSSSEVGKLKNELQSERLNSSGTEWARTNFIKVGENVANENISQNEATFKMGSDPTAYAHEIGHLMGLRHPGDPERGVLVSGQPGIMASKFNSVEPKYSIDGKPTKWAYDENGKPTKPIEGELDISKRKVLPSEVQSIVNLRQKGKTLGKYFVRGVKSN